MSQFEIQNDLDGRIFLSDFSKINERFDPIFHKAVEKIEKEVVERSKYDCDTLIKSCSLKRGRFGHRPRNDPDFYGGEYPFIQTGDIVQAAETDGKIQFSQTLNEKGLGTSRLFNPPQLLFTIAANIGDTAILDYPCCFPDSIVTITPKEKEKVNIEYLNYYLRLIKPYVVELAPYSAQRNLNNQQLSEVPIIIPPKDIQEEIIAISKAAYREKTRLISVATESLNSIDSYILRELGIILPERDTSIEARMFQTTFQELSGRRFDPKLFDTHSKNLFSAVENAQYPKEPLKKLITHSAAGDWGIDEEAEVKEDQYDTCLVIRATEFDNLYNLKLENDRVRHRKIKKDKLKQLDIQPYDLLIEKSGGSPDQPVGRISLLTEDLLENNTLCYSNFIHKIRVDSSRIDPSYLFCFLKTIHNIKITEIMQSQTNGIRNLIMGEYFNQSIVLPKLDKQIEIGKEANRRRFEAQRLSIEADKVLEDARKVIEEMILK